MPSPGGRVEDPSGSQHFFLILSSAVYIYCRQSIKYCFLPRATMSTKSSISVHKGTFYRTCISVLSATILCIEHTQQSFSANHVCIQFVNICKNAAYADGIAKSFQVVTIFFSTSASHLLLQTGLQRALVRSFPKNVCILTTKMK